ncbi:Metal-dependent hydrolase, endonuclease/exonuclease/phosphatase family [Vibrio hangzhouensis]|uniref:Metal-dependent hydrolase, endonuclease/exonuclease/phosphatase family n=1 Tax=Vibrio hangzhouensis TaxID=462991 RepID=A0A1H5TBW9_9VIBR|nr:Metal-dependent hydrolase, endonuclease/exonuclease/phosphatase family [Vibrio hangzhouensis]
MLVSNAITESNTVTQINTLKVTTCNLCNFVEPPFAFYEMDNIYSAKQWQQKTNWLQETLKKLDSDIIAFQEVFSVAALQSLTKALGYPYFEFNQQPELESEYIFSHPALAIASRYPLKKRPNLALHASQEGEFSRPPLHITATIEGMGELDIYNVHLKSKRPVQTESPLEDESHVELWLQELEGSELSTRLRHLEALGLHQNIVRVKQRTKRPFLLLGDFNNHLSADEFAPFHSQYRHRRKESLSELRHYHFHDSWRLIPRGIPTRASEALREPITHYYGESGSRLDYILTSNEFNPEYDLSLFELIDYELVNKHIIDPIFGIDDISTDHALVSIRFQIRP